MTDGTHEHECRKCRRCWSHGDDNFENRAAHTCECGYVEWTIRPKGGYSAFLLWALLQTADEDEKRHD